MRHLPADYLASKPYRVAAGCDVTGEVKQLLYDNNDVLSALGQFSVFKFFGDDGLVSKGVGTVSDFADPPTIFFEDDYDTWEKRPSIRMCVEVEFGEGDDDPARYVRMFLDGKDFKREFASGDPLADWSEMIAFTKANPAQYRLDHSGFHDFLYSVPGYKFDVDDDGNEFLTVDPTDAIDEEVGTARTGVIGMNYNPGHRPGKHRYRSIEVHCSDKHEPIEFASGDLIKDWQDCCAFLKEHGYMAMLSSSIDSFPSMLKDYVWGQDDSGRTTINPRPAEVAS